MHWFDFTVFFAETDRVLTKNGVLAFWCYGLGRISPPVDEVIRVFFFTMLGPFWPSERRYIEEEYRTISLPMDEIPALALSSRRSGTSMLFWDILKLGRR